MIPGLGRTGFARLGRDGEWTCTVGGGPPQRLNFMVVGNDREVILGKSYSYGPLPVISTYNPSYRMYNPIYPVEL